MDKNTIEVPLTNEEQQALNELAILQDLSRERVMIQALRLYQLVTLGMAKVEFTDDGLRLQSPIGG